MMIRSSAIAFALAAASVACMAQGLSLPKGALGGLPPLASGALGDQFDKVKAVKRIPVQGLSMIETTEGKVFLLSDNGRLAIIGGRWVDMWEGKQIANIADAASLDKMDLRRMGVNLDELSTYVIGTGPRKVTAFFDPLCSSCQSLAREMSSAAQQFTFTIVLMPLGGAPSGAAARRMHCSPDKSLALSAFMANKFDTLPESPRTCDVMPLQKAMILSRVLSISRTPHFVMESGAAFNAADMRLAEVLKR